MFEIMEKKTPGAIIKVIGVGGCGCNAVTHMMNKGMVGVEFICLNTDRQALNNSHAQKTLQIGSQITKGLGAGAKPEVGQAAAEEDRSAIIELLEGADMVFIAAGMGGGTGTGATPVVAQISKQLGILTIAVVTKPFKFEGNRLKIASEGLANLSQHVDSLIVVPNDKLADVLGKGVTVTAAYMASNDVLFNAVSGIAEVINCTGLVNVDFADVRTLMSEMGMAMMGSAESSGDERARLATERAIASPLLEDAVLSNARGILVNITATEDSFTLDEYAKVMETVNKLVGENATVIIGQVFDDGMGDLLRVTIVITGLSNPWTKDNNLGKRVTSGATAPYNGNYDTNNADSQSAGVNGSNSSTGLGSSANYDIPTFLRNNDE